MKQNVLNDKELNQVAGGAGRITDPSSDPRSRRRKPCRITGESNPEGSRTDSGIEEKFNNQRKALASGFVRGHE